MQKMISTIKAIFAVLFVFVSGGLVNVLELLTLIIRPFSRDAFRKVNKFLISLHWPVLVWLVEKWAKIEIIVYGDPIPDNETMLGVLNHRSDVDWMIGFAVCGRHCGLGALKVIVKTGHLMIPVFGIMEYFAEFIFLKRNWQDDEKALDKGINGLKTYPRPFWFIIFPEGTRFSQTRKEANQKWAVEHGMKPLEHVMWPKAKAFALSVQNLKDHVDAVYDATMAFEKEVSLMDLFKGEGNTRVHFYLKRRPISEIASQSEGELTTWLNARWEEKETRMKTFKELGRFDDPQVLSERPMPSEAFVAAWLLVIAAIALAAVLLLPATAWTYLRYAGYGVLALVPICVIGLKSALKQTNYQKKAK